MFLTRISQGASDVEVGGRIFVDRCGRFPVNRIQRVGILSLRAIQQGFGPLWAQPQREASQILRYRGQQELIARAGAPA